NGSIVVQPGADMDWAFNGDFSNQGTITIGSATTNAAVTQGGLGINGAVTLDGHGTLNLGLDNPLNIESTGLIGNGSNALTNVDNTIAGAGAIIVGQFDY